PTAHSAYCRVVQLPSATRWLGTSWVLVTLSVCRSSMTTETVTVSTMVLTFILLVCAVLLEWMVCSETLAVTPGEHADQLSLSSLGRDQHAESGPCEREQFRNGHALVVGLSRVLCLNHDDVGVTLPACPRTRDRVLLPDHATLAPTLHPGTGVVLVNGRGLETGHCFLLCVWCDCLPHNTQ